jgi:hypothetical protein
MSLLTSSTELVLALVVSFSAGTCRDYATQKRVCKQWSAVIDKYCDWEHICYGFEVQQVMKKFRPKRTLGVASNGYHVFGDGYSVTSNGSDAMSKGDDAQM